MYCTWWQHCTVVHHIHTILFVGKCKVYNMKSRVRHVLVQMYSIMFSVIHATYTCVRCFYYCSGPVRVSRCVVCLPHAGSLQQRLKYWVCMWMVQAWPVRWYVQQAASMRTSPQAQGGWWCCLCVFVGICKLVCTYVQAASFTAWRKLRLEKEPRLSTRTHGLRLPWPTSWHQPLCSHQRRIPTLEAPNIFLAGRR